MKHVVKYFEIEALTSICPCELIKPGSELLIVGLILLFTSQSTIFQLCRGGSSWVEQIVSWGLMCLGQGHSAVTPTRVE